MNAVTYHRLTPLARCTISDYGVSIAAYVREWAPDGQWGGDKCGCPDSRCVGYHHEEHEDCGCLESLLRPIP